MSVNISPQGQEIIKACELKVKLQGRAEALSEEARDLIARLKVISDEQTTILYFMADFDRKIEYLANSAATYK